MSRSAPPRRLPWFLLDLSKGASELNKYLKHIGITLSVAVLYLETGSLNKLVSLNVQNRFCILELS